MTSYGCSLRVETQCILHELASLDVRLARSIQSKAKAIFSDILQAHSLFFSLCLFSLSYVYDQSYTERKRANLYMLVTKDGQEGVHGVTLEFAPLLYTSARVAFRRLWLMSASDGASEPDRLDKPIWSRRHLRAALLT